MPQSLYSASTGGFYTPDIHGDDIPSDAVEVTADEKAALFAGQAEGKLIVPGAGGKPVLADKPAATDAELAAVALVRRAQLLTSTDWITLRSLEVGVVVPANWAAYRQALRDIPQQAGFPQTIAWPTPPAS